MRLLLVVDVFMPVWTSASIQIYDLAMHLARLGHDCTVVTPADQIAESFTLSREGAISVLRIRTKPIKGVGLVRRAVNEMMLSWIMWRVYRTTSVSEARYDGVVFYSPSIFFGRFVAKLKAIHHCRAYLILRDVFPDWAVDLELMRKSPQYWFFKWFASYQYSVADKIGVESAANRRFVEGHRCPIEVLSNWITPVESAPTGFALPSELAKRRILVSAGTMGIAQDMDNLIRLAEKLRDRADVRLLLIGSGSERLRLKEKVKRLGLQNVIFHSEIDRAQLRQLLRHCHVGLVSLDSRLRTHNTPGRLLSYLEAGLPVLASVNPGNAIKQVIEDAGAGTVLWNGDDEGFAEAARRMLDDTDNYAQMSEAARILCRTRYTTTAAARQILRFFDSGLSTS